MRAAAGLDRADALRRQRLVAHQELGVFPREDVVGDDARGCESSRSSAAERQQQRGLAAADRPADADGERARAIVARERRAPLAGTSPAPPGNSVVDAWSYGMVVHRELRHVELPQDWNSREYSRSCAACSRSTTARSARGRRSSSARARSATRRATAAQSVLQPLRLVAAGDAEATAAASTPRPCRNSTTCWMVGQRQLRCVEHAARSTGATWRARPRTARRQRRRAPATARSARRSRQSVRPWTRLARLATGLVRNASASASSASSRSRIAIRRVHAAAACRSRPAAAPRAGSRRSAPASAHLALLPRRLEARTSARTRRSGTRSRRAARCQACSAQAGNGPDSSLGPASCSEQKVALRQRQHRRRLRPQLLAVGRDDVGLRIDA